MIRHIWTVACSRGVVDKASNNVSLQNVLEQLTIIGEPSHDLKLRLELAIVSFWIRSNMEQPAFGRVRVTFVSPSGEDLASIESEINMLDHARSRNIMRAGVLPLPEAGYYNFRVDVQHKDSDTWQQVALVPLEVKFNPPSDATEGEGN
jgi:hypothetical protein